MKTIKNILFEHVGPWVKSALADVKAWLSFLFTSIASALGQFLAGLDAAAIQAWTKRQWAFRLLITLGPGIITALATGRPHQTAEDIAAKLAALSSEERAKLLVGTDVK